MKVFPPKMVLTNLHKVTLNKSLLLKHKIFVCTVPMAQCSLSNLEINWKILRNQNPPTVIYFLYSLLKLESWIDSVIRLFPSYNLLRETANTCQAQVQNAHTSGCLINIFQERD